MDKPKDQSFYVVSLGKLALLYFATMGLYWFYWFYRGFKTVERQTGRPMLPAARSLFSVLFVHELFNHVRRRERDKGEPYHWHPSKLAWWFVGINAVQVLAMLVVLNYEGRGIPVEISWVFKLLIFLLKHAVQFAVLYSVQLVINRLEGDPFGRANEKVTSRNQMWIVLGLVLWLNMFYGFYLQAVGRWPPVNPASPAPAMDSL